MVEAGQVADVTITGNEIKGHFASREPFRTFAPLGYDKLVDTLLARKVTVNYQPDQTPTWANMLISWAPFLLLIGFWIFFMRQMQTGGNKALSFGKSKAKLLASQQKKVTFKDVAGVDEAKEELQEIIEFLREPQKFQKLGGPHPQGRPPHGPPGDGQDAARPRHRRRGERAVLLDLRLGLRRDVRGRGRFPRPRPLRAGEEERPLHHLHRRDRRGGPPSGRRPRRRARRARADPEPAPRGDGRLRVERRRHPDRGHQPARRARSRAPAPRPLRPAGGGLPARRARPRGHHPGPHPQDPARRRRGDRRRSPGPPPASPGPTSRTS